MKIVLKYFATNRNLDKLGRAVDDSSDRHRLSRGGYYFVDMEKYMRFYLGTTDADEMPSGAVELRARKVKYCHAFASPDMATPVRCSTTSAAA